MSDEEEKPFAVERAKTSRAKCKKCKCAIEKDTIRIAKLVANPFSDGKMKAWHHLSCLFEVFAKQRATTKRIDDPEEDVSGWKDLCEEDRGTILRRIEEFENSSPFDTGKTAKPAANRSTDPKKRKRDSDKSSSLPSGYPSSGKKSKNANKNDSTSSNDDASDISSGISSGSKRIPEEVRKPSRDDAFEEFQRLCDNVAKADAYTEKTAIVRKTLTKGSEGDGFKSDVKLWCRMLLPGAVKRVYNLQSKQLLKLFSRVFHQDEDEMLEHLDQGDVAETVRVFFRNSNAVRPAPKSVLTVQEVDEFLQKLSSLTKEDEQIHHLRSIVSRCTENDLKTIVRLIKHDLRINAGPKHILGAVHENAYEAFQTSRDLDSVIERCGSSQDSSKLGKPSAASGSSSNVKITLSLMTPVLPMLAEACKSVEMAMKKCPNGMLAEVKYDGERVQVHKKGNEFRYFSRSLKPVLAHKVNLFKSYIPKAFPDADDLILDSEVLMIDTKTGQPLPFGSLGIHKKTEFKDANVCLFVFDCMYYNGDVLLHKSVSERRRILTERMTEIPNRIMLSEVEEIRNPQELAEMIVKVLKLGLEGLVLKSVHSKYEPGKRHWLKIKKDYLYDGAIADSADLVVLGAWYGTGNKGGMMSIFLMGCYDEDRGNWVTVTKVHTGHDDATLTMLQDELDMVKIGKDPGKVPRWLRANKPMIPDFVAKDPKKQPVWEITGAEFTNQGVHTADGISVRFPRVTRIRYDKDWASATTLNELRNLFKRSTESMEISSLLPSNFDCEKEILNKNAAKEDSPSKSKTNSGSKSKSNSPLKTNRGIKKLKTRSPKDIDQQRYTGEETNASNQEDSVEDSALRISLNWIEEEPRKDVPSDPKSLFSLETKLIELRSTPILKGVPVSVAPTFEKSKGRHVREILITLEAEVLNDQERSKAMYVIHPSKEILSSAIREYEDVSKAAKHVSVSWLKTIVSISEIPRVEEHAVAIIADYCTCPCLHRS